MRFRLRTLLIVLAVLPAILAGGWWFLAAMPGRLGDIGPPDGKERRVNGVIVRGSALTDAHVEAIFKLTDDTRPKDFDEHWLRGIIHEGPNRADHVWQAATYQKYQKLQLVNGSWQIIEDGDGFGNFSGR